MVENNVEADSVTEVLKILAAENLKPLSVTEIKGKGGREIFKGSINLEDQVFLFRYLSLMLRMGSNLLQAINILVDEFDKPAMRSFLMEVRAHLERGAPFYTAFEKYPRTFSSVHINLVKAGEVSGNLQQVCEDIAVSLTKEKQVKDQVKNALIYPAMLLTISVFILIFLVTFALPRIANVFLESGFEPPLFSKIVFTIGLFVSKIWFVLVGAGIAAIIGGVVAYKRSLFFKKFIWSLFTNIPVVREVVEKYALQRFASTLSSLIQAGLQITDAIDITADAVGNIELREALKRISHEGVSKGLTLGEAFRREPFFPKIVTNLVAISEKAGHVEEILETLGEFYIREVDNSIKRLVSFTEPVLLLLIGVVIGTIALAIIVPIYQLTTQF
ncbi:hypothetical protein A2110_02065 [Candidatus Jorgensenbacteria bacterium GWA1_54_12]|uniref:Type II secretion system protein GspF domain-containing protein n=1 Tax=Candidatus Jorgensenbacteria bacterium GWA1_54_12 TaxID=1798468 RepID=A0A1F6BLE9_9BACT|nr:MAG: hypothetical protein A2110_02065 [Candidatus Jorgensenbacteria bacterium GWA1_54_12]